MLTLCCLPVIGAIGVRGGAETTDTVFTGVACRGNESVILDCPGTLSTECLTQEIATVICQGKLACMYTHTYVCILGALLHVTYLPMTLLLCDTCVHIYDFHTHTQSCIYTLYPI